MGKNAKEALLLEIARRLKAVDVAGLQDTQQGVSNLIDKPEACHLFITWDYLPSAWHCPRNNACAVEFKQKSSTQYTSTALSIIQVRINR